MYWSMYAKPLLKKQIHSEIRSQKSRYRCVGREAGCHSETLAAFGISQIGCD